MCAKSVESTTQHLVPQGGSHFTMNSFPVVETENAYVSHPL